MAATLRTITLIISLLGIAVWLIVVVKNRKSAVYTIPIFIYLANMATRYISMQIVGYTVVIAKYQVFFSTWTTVTNLYILLVIMLAGVIVWRD